MSEKLAISSALSVFLMASYVLLSGDARQVELRPMDSMLSAISAPTPTHQVGTLLAR